MKQCLLPNPFSLLCVRPNSCTSSTDRAGYTRSVPYSTLPAQLWSFSCEAQAANLVRNGLVIAAEQILRNVLLFMAPLEESGRAFFFRITDGPDFIPICPYKAGARLIQLLQKPSRHVARSPSNLFSKRKVRGNVCEWMLMRARSHFG